MESKNILFGAGIFQEKMRMPAEQSGQGEYLCMIFQSV